MVKKFVLKRIPTYKNKPTLSPFRNIMNPGIIRGIFRNLECSKFEGSYIPVKQIVMSI